MKWLKKRNYWVCVYRKEGFVVIVKRVLFHILKLYKLSYIYDAYFYSLSQFSQISSKIIIQWPNLSLSLLIYHVLLVSSFATCLSMTVYNTPRSTLWVYTTPNTHSQFLFLFTKISCFFYHITYIYDMIQQYNILWYTSSTPPIPLWSNCHNIRLRLHLYIHSYTSVQIVDYIHLPLIRCRFIVKI